MNGCNFDVIKFVTKRFFKIKSLLALDKLYQNGDQLKML